MATLFNNNYQSPIATDVVQTPRVQSQIRFPRNAPYNNEQVPRVNPQITMQVPRVFTQLPNQPRIFPHAQPLQPPQQLIVPYPPVVTQRQSTPTLATQTAPTTISNPRRSQRIQTKQSIHMGNFLQRIYIKEKYNLSTDYYNAIIDPKTGQSLEYRHLIKNKSTRKIWNTSFANELGRLANGVGDRIAGTKTIAFIQKNMVPVGRKVTYGRIVVDFRPLKSEPNRTRLTVGGDKIDYPGQARTDTADIVTAKLLLNSVVSTPRARCCILDIKDFYLNNKLLRYEYMRMPISLFPEEIIKQYNLQKIV